MVFGRLGTSVIFAVVGTSWCATALAQTQPSPSPADAQPSPGTPPPPPPSTDPRDALIPPNTQSPQDPAAPPGVDPAGDQQKLIRQGSERPTNDGLIGGRTQEIYSDDWWSHTRPILELHGYFRTRGELFHNFALGRHDSPTDPARQLWPHPLDHTYTDLQGNRRVVALCNDPGPQGQLGECEDKTEAHANLRLRLNPEIHVSDNLRVMAQVDLLDNLVLGSTPDAYALRPTGRGVTGYGAAGTAYNPTGRFNGYAPLGAFSTTQGPPTAGVNGYRNSIDVQRAWAEYLTPLGQVRFGRMPHHWGLGMLANSGDGIDHDWQSNVDRIMFVTGLKSADLYFGGAWDFVSTGTTMSSPYDVYGGQPYNNNNLSNVNQWGAFVVRRTNPEMQRLKLARNEVVLNGGLYALYRSQLIDVVAGETPLTADRSATNNGLERRGAKMLTPDVWVQLLWNKLRVEVEAASIWGSMERSPASERVNDPVKLRMWGVATQAEMKAVEDKLRVQFGAGWASGDPNVEGLTPGGDARPLQTRPAEAPISTFRFHPAYNIDYIFFRRILTRIQGAYYFRPSVEYDFVRNPNGQKFGGGAAIIWSRASEFIQAPGNKRDLGVELDLQLYYQSKDGSLNDDPTKMGGFFGALQYGVFFPLGGLEYLPGQRGSLTGTQPTLANYDLSAAHTIRLILGVLF